MVVGLLRLPDWLAAVWIAIGAGWFYQLSLARKEIRRREEINLGESQDGEA